MAGDKAKEVHEKARSDQGSGRLIEVAFWFVVWYLSSVMCTNFSKEVENGTGKAERLMLGAGERRILFGLNLISVHCTVS
eukprot:1315128-Amorphochlora_amoeboformis.AAC.2